MTIRALLRAVPPPAEPADAFGGPWEPIEAELGTPLPQDYKDFVRVYGFGAFMDFLHINVPYSWSPYVRLVAEARTVCGFFAEDPYFEHALWPVPGGLLPFGRTDFGDYLFWRTDGGPSEWRVAVWDRGMQSLEFLDCDLTDFLAGLATGEILPKEFPEGLLPCEALFRPFKSMPPTDEAWLSTAGVQQTRPRLLRFGPIRARMGFPWPAGF